MLVSISRLPSQCSWGIPAVKNKPCAWFWNPRERFTYLFAQIYTSRYFFYHVTPGGLCIVHICCLTQQCSWTFQTCCLDPQFSWIFPAWGHVWMRTGIFPVICTGNVPTQDEVIFPDHCLCGCGGKESSHIGCRGAKLVKLSDGKALSRRASKPITWLYWGCIWNRRVHESLS